MASGIGLSPECLEKFQELKLRKSFKYIIYKVSNDHTEIIVEKTVESDSYDNFLKDLPENECRYAVYDFDYIDREGGKRNKIVFISWSPDDARIRDKMLYASSKETLRRSLRGIAAEIQGTNYDEVSYESVLDKVRGAA